MIIMRLLLCIMIRQPPTSTLSGTLFPYSRLFLSLAASAGDGTGEGIRLEGSWTHRKLLPTEGALTFRGVLGTQEQGIGATLRRSNAGRRDRTFELVTEVTRSTYDAFNAITGRVGARVSYDSTPIWQKKFTYA